MFGNKKYILVTPSEKLAVPVLLDVFRKHLLTMEARPDGSNYHNESKRSVYLNDTPEARALLLLL